MRKVALLFAVCGSAVLVTVWATLSLVSCAAGRRASGRPAVKISVGGDELNSESEVGWGKLQIAKFQEYARERGWDDIELRVTTSVGDEAQKYIASTIAGEGADVILLSPNGVPQFADHGLLEPLDGYIEEWRDYQEGRINKSVLDMCRGADGKVIGIAAARMGPFFWVVRRDWLERLGLEAPTTWEEARRVWQAFTHDDPDGNGEDDTYGFMISMQTTGGTHLTRLLPFMLAAGVFWYGFDDRGEVIPTFNTPEAARVLKFIKECYEEGLFGADVMNRVEKQSVGYLFMIEDAAGMAWGYPPDWYKSVAVKYGKYDKLQVVPFLWRDDQAKKQRRYGCRAGLSSLLCMMSNSKNKDAAWKYMQFCFSRERLTEYFGRRGAPQYRGRYLGRFGLYSGEPPWLPVRNDCELPETEDEEIEKLVRPLDGFVVPIPAISAWTEIRTALSEVFVDYYLGRYPGAQAALGEGERRFKEIYAAGRRNTGADSPSGRTHP